MFTLFARIVNRKKKRSSNDNDATMMNTVPNAAPAPPAERDYYNVNAVDQGSYGQLSDVTNDSHTYDQLNKTTVHH